MKIATLAQVLSCDFYEISKDTFFTEQVWATASVIWTAFQLFLKVYSDILVDVVFVEFPWYRSFHF